MDIGLLLAISAIIIYIIGAFPYMYDTVKGKVIPHPFSWGVWLILISLNLSTLYTSDVWWWAFLPIIVRMSFILFWTISWIILIKKININWFDYLCLFLSIISILVFYSWVDYAVFITIITAMFVIAPTIKKIWNNPKSEDVFLWFCVFLSQALLLLSIENKTVENTAFWIYTMVENLLICFLILLRRQKRT